MIPRQSLFLLGGAAFVLALGCGGGSPNVEHQTPAPVITSFEADPPKPCKGEPFDLVASFSPGTGFVTHDNGVKDGELNAGGKLPVGPISEGTIYTWLAPEFCTTQKVRIGWLEAS